MDKEYSRSLTETEINDIQNYLANQLPELEKTLSEIEEAKRVTHETLDLQFTI